MGRSKYGEGMERIDQDDIRYMAREVARNVGREVRPHWMSSAAMAAWRVAMLAAVAWIGLAAFMLLQHASSSEQRKLSDETARIVESFRDEARRAAP